MKLSSEQRILTMDKNKTVPFLSFKYAITKIALNIIGGKSEKIGFVNFITI